MKIGTTCYLRGVGLKMVVVAVSRSGDVYKCVYVDNTGVLRETRWLPAAVLESNS